MSDAQKTKPVAYIIGGVLSELQKHKTATGTVWSPLRGDPTGSTLFDGKVPLYAAPQVPTVKALEWDDEDQPAAKCIFGHYVINPRYSMVELFIGYGGGSLKGLGRIQLEQGSSLDALKVAAQSDYNRRVLTAINMPEGSAT